jgi:hypothetical protein
MKTPSYSVVAAEARWCARGKDYLDAQKNHNWQASAFSAPAMKHVCNLIDARLRPSAMMCHHNIIPSAILFSLATLAQDLPQAPPIMQESQDQIVAMIALANILCNPSLLTLVALPLTLLCSLVPLNLPSGLSSDSRQD